MTRDERFGERDLTYSRWHRSLEDELTYIDIDACEYCENCREPLALIETAMDVGQSFKATTVMRNLAKLAGIPAFLALYAEFEGSMNFRFRQVSPIYDPDWREMNGPEFADVLRFLRKDHECRKGN